MAKNTGTSDVVPAIDNLALWNCLEKTDPAYTKPFKGKGGFSGTAINGTYLLKRLTETFGPCGQGWRFVLDDEQLITGHTLKNGDKAVLHIVRGHLEYRTIIVPMPGEEVAWIKTSPQFGQTMMVDENKYGTFMDEEAPKKSITDCISKCCVLLGIGADVFLGMFDDSKYVNQRRQEEAAERGPEPPPAPSPNGGAEPPQQGAPGTTDDMTVARHVFTLVKTTAEQATDLTAINDCLKHNGASLKVLERASPPNYENLKKIVQENRQRLTPPIEHDLNEDPGFINV